MEELPRKQKINQVSMAMDRRIEVLVASGKKLLGILDDEAVIRKAMVENPWFTEESIRTSIHAVVDNYLSREKLEDWVSKYSILTSDTGKKVGLVLAGNIPLVGIHDIIATYITGHTAQVKLSSKDAVLMKVFAEALGDKIELVERLEGFDAVIATGSNNTSRYFTQYFGKYPHIIRKNRNAVAILSGDESDEELLDLGKDIFTHFGLGCRNVSKVYVPEGYNMAHLLEVLHDEYKEAANHNKYKNNFDYNVAILLLNSEPYLNSGCLIVRESQQIPSNISILHYEYYTELGQVVADLHTNSEIIQCIVTNMDINDVDTLPLGQAQSPTLMDYADGVDTMEFLTSLS